ncbi:hypothetical protein BDW74DRAFT_182974 [Aspergillus multicolor]|uniref:Hsp70 family protein n=1 Tax=Aspergillus multicolor TaxID=41759 RepID=UPI003CCCF547
MTDRDHKIVVGVDYGTTFTGASFVGTQSKGLNDVHLITSWPGSSKSYGTNLKTPSRIMYDGAGNCRWGYQVKPGVQSYSWTKLLLDRGSRLTNYDAALENATAPGMFDLPEDKDEVEVAGDFLSGVYNHILTCIAKRITEEALNRIQLEFWFTVPAIWSDQAKHATLKAARRAGFGSRRGNVEDTICLIPEPEAAAIAVLKRSTEVGLPVKPEDGVLVCDCGGGTVDITTYLVKEVRPILRFEELCTGYGAKCGSTAIDREFYGLMRRKFGKAFTDLSRIKTAPGSHFMNQFERIKRDFGHDSENTTYDLPLRMGTTTADPAYFRADEGQVVISDQDLRGLFDPVVKKILELIRQQINDANLQAGRNAINRIILVGGFGDSEYLRLAVRNAFDPATTGIALTVPQNSQPAIVRCRRHYGVEVSKPFREGIDKEADAFIHNYHGLKYANGYMAWTVPKGTVFADNFSCDHEFFQVHEEDDSLVFSDSIYCCDTDEAPSRREHEDVREVGKIKMDMREVDITRFPYKDYMEKRAYYIEYHDRIIFGAREGVLKFESHMDGQVIGKTSINYNRETRW